MRVTHVHHDRLAAGSYDGPVSRRPCLVAAALAGLVAGAAARDASAIDLELAAGADASLHGDHLFGTVRIAGTLRVDSAEPSWLYLRAHTIVIEEGGVIDASASGHRGTTIVGAGPGAGGTPPEVALATAAPAGGGAHVGGGGSGATAGRPCTLSPSAPGGTVYDTRFAFYADADPLEAVTRAEIFGSSGGTSHSGPPNDWLGRGGHGGGVVVLEAATITMNGAVRADGEPGANTLGAGPGGGAGGTIWIRGTNVDVGASASLSARGASGAAATGLLGGSGGGGWVLVHVPARAGGDALVAVALVDGGPTVAACAGTQGFGGAAPPPLVPALDCIDADRDGHPNVACGGDDCDDGDQGAAPGATEICNDRDDDCDNAIDEDDGMLCPGGSAQTCQAGDCVDVMGGQGGGAAGGREVELGGGVCGVAPGGVAAARQRVPLIPWALVAPVLGLVLCVARRRSRPRS
jgi:hypothetical protein